MAEEKIISISGVGFSSTVTVQDGETVADALKKAGLDPAELDVSVDGETPASEVEEVVATPKEAKLG